jgi:hypothetical protein
MQKKLSFTIWIELSLFLLLRKTFKNFQNTPYCDKWLETFCFGIIFGWNFRLSIIFEQNIGYFINFIFGQNFTSYPYQNIDKNVP